MTLSPNKLALSLILLGTSLQVEAQEGKLKKFMRLSSPEKCWVFTHPFIAAKALRISEHTQKIVQMKGDSLELDTYASGGQVDAFRHCFWMASLCQQIKEKKALKLGIAHEEGNEKDFKKRQYEEGSLPDAAANIMDLWNNNIGAALIREHPNLSGDLLIFTAKAAVTTGRCKIISRNARGDFLNREGGVIALEDWHGKWVNPRCLVPSDQSQN